MILKNTTIKLSVFVLNIVVLAISFLYHNTKNIKLDHIERKKKKKKDGSFRRIGLNTLYRFLCEEEELVVILQ